MTSLEKTVEPDAAPAEAIEAVPLRHPWRWISATIVLILIALFVYGAATNPNYHWDTYRAYLFDQRISTAAWNTLQLTFWAMVLGVGLGIVLAIMRLSPNPVLTWAAWGFLWIFRGTPVYVQLVFWGLFTSLYPHLDFGLPIHTSVRALEHSDSQRGILFCRPGSGLERGRLHGRDRPCRHHLGERRAD